MTDVLATLEAACRVRPLSRAQLGRIGLHMTAAAVRTIPVQGLLFERGADGVQVHRLPTSAYGAPTRVAVEDLN